MTTVQVNEQYAKNGTANVMDEQFEEATPAMKPKAVVTSTAAARAKFEALKQQAQTASENAVQAGQALIEAARERKAALEAELREVNNILNYTGGAGLNSNNDNEPSVLAWSGPYPPKPRRGRPAKATAKASGVKTGRLPRRSAEEIAIEAQRVLALVKKAGKTGMRAEQIRAELKMAKNEWPKVIHAAIATKLLKVTGQKRSTAYFAK